MIQSFAIALLTRAIQAVLVFTIVASTDAPSALAHSMLVKAEPPQRAVLAKSPERVRLWFNEDIEGDYASLVVFDGDKRPITDLKPQLAQDDPKSIVLPLPELPPGKYSVKFRVLSVDGHVVESSFDFTVKGKVHGK